MWIIHRVELMGYGSFRNYTKVSLEGKGLVFVRGNNFDTPNTSSNGAGKSTLFEAIDWCLFGQPPKGDVASSIIHPGASSADVCVELRNTSTKEKLIINRSRLVSGKTQLGLDGQVWMDVAETQKQIEARLGLTRDIFHAAVFWTQSDHFSFADASDAQRKKLLVKILPMLERIDDLAASHKALHVEDVEDRISSYNGMLATEQTIQVNQEILISTLATQSEMYQIYLKELESKVQDYPTLTWIESDTGVLSDKYILALESLNQRCSINTDQTEKTELEASQAKERIQELNDKISALPKLVCDYCGQATPSATHHNLQQELKYWENRLADKSQFLHVLHMEKVSLDKEITDTKFQHQHKLHELQILRQSRLNAEAAVKQHKEQEPASAVEALKKAQKTLEEAEEKQKKYHEVLDELTRLREDLEFWTKGLSTKGLKSYALDAYLGFLTESANHWVGALTGGQFSVRFESQSKTTKSLVEKTNIRVFKHNSDGTTTERNYRSWSGGEKRRVALGVDYGIASLVASQAKTTWGTLILDESFRAHLDMEGRTAVVGLLQELKKEKDSIFVIDHDPEFQAHFENVWTVDLHNGVSTVTT